MTDPREAETSNLHPALERVARGYRLASVLVSIAGLAIGGMFVAFMLSMRTSGNFLPVLLIAAALPPLGMFIWLKRHLRTTLIPRLLDANRLLTEVPARKVSATPLGTGDLKGMLIELADPGKEDRPWGLASASPARRRKLGRKPLDLDLHMHSSGLDRALVLVGPDLLFFGSLATPEDLSRSWRQLRLFLFGLLALLAVIVGSMFMAKLRFLDMLEQDMVEAEASLQWPRAQGAVTASALEQTRIRRGRSSVEGWDAAIEYTYRVEGEEFSSAYIHYGWRPTRNLDKAKALVDAYPVGAAVQPAFDPQNPALAVLEPGHMDAVEEWLDEEKSRMFTGMIAGLLGLVVTSVVMVLIYRRRKQAMERVFHLADARDPTS